MSIRKNNFCILILFFLTSCFLQLNADTTPETKESANKQNDVIQPHLLNLFDTNMRLFPWENSCSNSENSNKEYIEYLFDHCTNPTPRNKRIEAFDLLLLATKGYQALDLESASHDATTWQDLNIFCGSSDINAFVAKTVTQTKTEYGTVSLYHLLSQPTTNISLLEQRQNVIKTLLSNPSLHQKLDNTFTTLAAKENVLLSLWGSPQHCLSPSVNGDFLFKDFFIIKRLNENHHALLIKYWLGAQEKIYNI